VGADRLQVAYDIAVEPEPRFRVIAMSRPWLVGDDDLKTINRAYQELPRGSDMGVSLRQLFTLPPAENISVRKETHFWLSWGFA
jgi:hypothetical protein